MKEIPDGSIDLTVTSPPYDNLRTYNGNINQWCFEKFQRIAEELYRITKDGGVVVWIVADATINGSETGTSFKQALYFKDCGFKLHDTMIWQKISPYQHKNRYIQSFEYMFVFSKGARKTANLICDRKNKHGGVQIHGTERKADGTIRNLSDVQKSKVVKEFGARYNIWDIPPVKQNKHGHPAPFPENLIEDHIITWSNEGDVVFDPFLGSGTTCIAAVNTDRHYIGFELDPQYFQIACDRLDECRKFCDTVAELPYFKDFIDKGD
jgi:site-specific DNA-methyltransferase (adenine-specific)